MTWVAQAVAQMCANDRTFAESMKQFRFIEAVSCQYAGGLGMFVVATLFYTPIALSIYIRTGSLAIPFVLLLLTGGAVMGQVAGIGASVATVVILLLVGLAVAKVYEQFGR